MFLHLVLNSWVCLYYVLSLSYSDFTCLCRQVPADPKAKPTKSGKQRRGGKGKRLKGMVVGETGTEVDVGPVPAKKAKKEGVLTFANKFKQPGSGKTPVQVWADKYGLTSVSGPSTYPANRDFEGHVGGCGATAPQRFFLFFLFFFRKNS